MMPWLEWEKGGGRGFPYLGEIIVTYHTLVMAADSREFNIPTVNNFMENKGKSLDVIDLQNIG